MPEELLELERFELHEPPAYFFRVTRREFIEADRRRTVLRRTPIDRGRARVRSARWRRAFMSARTDLSRSSPARSKKGKDRVRNLRWQQPRS